MNIQRVTLSSQITARDHRDFSSVDGIIITSIATFPSSSVSLFVRYREDGGFGGPHHLVVDGGSTGSLFAPTPRLSAVVLPTPTRGRHVTSAARAPCYGENKRTLSPTMPLHSARVAPREDGVLLEEAPAACCRVTALQRPLLTCTLRAEGQKDACNDE